MSNEKYNDEQKRILESAGLSQPRDLPADLRLRFANAETKAKTEDPALAYRLHLDIGRMRERGLDPVQRIELQRLMDCVSNGRFERAKKVEILSINDAAYLAAMQTVLPFVDEASAEKINIMLPFYK